MRVETHLHIARFLSGKDDCISVRLLPHGAVAYHSSINLKEVTFAVQPAGLRRFRETGQKNVHAFVRGTVDHSFYTMLDMTWKQAKYNPAINDTFVDSVSGLPVYQADWVVMKKNRVYYR